MKRASPVELRKAMEATNALLKSGVLFVPMPVLSEDDHDELKQNLFERLNQIAAKIEHGQEKLLQDQSAAT